VEQPLSNDMGQLQCLAVAKFENPSAIATACEETSAEVEQPTVNETIFTSAMDSNVEAKSLKTNKSNDILHDNQLAKAYEDASSQSSKFPRVPSIIYLTSDSPHTLDVLSPFTTYVIGGIVDKNRHKGLCYKRAMARDIPTARLPIGEYMTMQSRSVLTTNHVAEIMLRWLEYGDWAKAFLRVIPKRKEARLKPNHGTDENSQGKRDGNISSDSQGD
jgi:tRNA (guanine9-N1)-methyltransferase